MSDVHVDRFYPHPPRTVWKAMTRPASVARWLAPGDFQARPGHRFTLTTPPAPGFDGQVRCEVLAVEPPRRLVLSWEGGPVHSVVRFELHPEGDGTRVSLVHEGLQSETSASVVPVLVTLWSDRLAGLSLELGAAGAGLGAAGVGAAAAVGGGIVAGALGVWLVVGLPAGGAASVAPDVTEVAERVADEAVIGGRDVPVDGGQTDTRGGPATGQLTYYEESLPTTLHPLFARTMVDQRVQELIFDRLFYRSAITSDLKSRLVNGFEVFDGGRRVKLELRTDVRWHDGEPLGPEDVCFTVAAMLDRRTPSQMAEPYRDVLAGCDVSEPDHAAVIEFTRPVHDARDWLSFLVVPAHAFATTALQPDDRFSVQPIGTGPMQGRLARRQVMLESFDNPHHQAHIRSVRISEGGDPYVQVRTTLSAGVHGMVSVAPPLRADIAASNDVALKSYDLRSWWFVAVDTRSGPLADVRIRQALDRSLDRNELRELTVGVDPHDPNPPVELVSGPFVPYSAYYNRTVQPRPHADLDDVRQLMEAAGATQQAGRWLLDGKPIELRIGMDAALNNEARDLLNQVGNQLQVAGFGRQVYKIPHDEWATEVVTGRMADRYDLLIGKWSFGSVENVSDLFHTRDAQGRGERNLFDYSDPTVDALLTRHDQATTDTEAQDAYHELHAHLAEQLPYLFLWKLDTKSAWRSEVRHNTITPYYYFTEFDGWQLR